MGYRVRVVYQCGEYHWKSDAYAELSEAKRAARKIASMPVLGGMAEIYKASDGWMEFVGYFAAGSKKYCPAERVGV